MDAKPKPMMPEIKAEVNKVDDGKKKATGALGGLFGSGGTGAAGGLGGLGAGAAGGGGLLATKAGMLALVIVGSSVAGGIGLAGYKMFGPSASDQTGGNLSLFAPKPVQIAEDGAGAASADGSSQSLSLMAQSAAKDKAAEAAASGSSEAAPTDNTAGSGSGAADAAAAEEAAKGASASNTPINAGGGAGATGNMGGSLTGVKKLGALSGASGSSGGSVGSASSAAGASARLGDNIANAAKNGATSGFSKGGPGAKASGARGAMARRGSGARSQARAVMGDQVKGRAGSSFAAGRTYDGSAPSGSGIGPDGSAISMGGAGDGGNAQPKALGASKRGDVNEQEVPPPGDGKAIVTEYEKNIKMVMILAALAAVLVYAAAKLCDTKVVSWGTTEFLIKAIGVAVIAIGIKMAMLAGQILHGANGEPGQKTPGTVAGIAALLAIGAGAYVMIAMSSADAEAKADADKAAAAKQAKSAELAQEAADMENAAKIEKLKAINEAGSAPKTLPASNPTDYSGFV